jgi:hypothetical protein
MNILDAKKDIKDKMRVRWGNECKRKAENDD